MAVQPSVQPLCVSLGMIVLDTLHFVNRPSMVDILGGSGTWATLGARLCIDASIDRDAAKAVGCIAVLGDDFPDTVLSTLRSWGVTLVTKQLPPGAKSTRGELTYLDPDFGNKTFRYLAPPQNPKAEHLAATPLLRVQAMHILASPADLRKHLTELAALRAKETIPHAPLIVYEPLPIACTAGQLGEILAAAAAVDVFSPNHLELLRLFDAGFGAEGYVFSKGQIERHARELLDAMVRPRGSSAFRPGQNQNQTQDQDQDPLGARPTRNKAVIVRAGEHGSLLLTASAALTATASAHSVACSTRDQCPGRTSGYARWFPAWHDAGSDAVVDATGAGNAFLGAVAVVLAAAAAAAATAAAAAGASAAAAAREPDALDALDAGDGESGESRHAGEGGDAAVYRLLVRDLEQGIVHGATAASFAIEQIGVPEMTRVDAGSGECSWGPARGSAGSFAARVEAYRAKLARCG